MLAVLAKIIPLDLAATLSPGILALAIILLANKDHPRSRLGAFFIGVLLIGIIITILGFYLGVSAPSGDKHSLTTAIIDLILGVAFLIIGLRAVFSKERHFNQKDEQSPHFFKWLIIGLIISATNFDALFLNFTAAKEVGGATLNDIIKLILLIVNLFFFTLPITLPVLLYLLMPKLADKVLGKINQFLLKFSKYLIFILFLVFGILLLYRGLKFFI